MATSPQIATFLSSSSTTTSRFRFHINTRPSYSYISPLPTPTNPSFSPNPITTTSKQSILFHHPPLKRKSRICTAEDAAAVDVIDTVDEGASVVVSALFFLAFIGLSAITIGVIYLAVVDFLQKREKDKFEKEEAAKTGNKKKKKKVVRAGPKGFGQKIIDDNLDDD